MARKRNMLRDVEKYAQMLLHEATGGAIGREPIRAKSTKDGEFSVDFGTKRALLDSMIKLLTVKSKVDPEDEDADGVETYKEMLRNDGSGEDRRTGDSEPPTASSSTASAILPRANGHAASDFLE